RLLLPYAGGHLRRPDEGLRGAVHERVRLLPRQGEVRLFGTHLRRLLTAVDVLRDSRERPCTEIGPVIARANCTWLTAALAGAALSFAAAGCDAGGGISPGTCGVAPCGGDVVGNWTGSSVCIDPATLSADILARLKGACPDVSLGATSVMSSGTLAMGADMSFT